MSKKNILNGESNIETIIFLVLHGIEERRKIIRGFYRYEKIATLLRGIDYIKVNLKRKKYKFNDTSKYEAILAVKELERNNYINVGLHGISPTATGMQRINKILEEKSIYHEEDYCLSSKERAILDSNGIDIGSMNGFSLFLFVI